MTTDDAVYAALDAARPTPVPRAPLVFPPGSYARDLPAAPLPPSPRYWRMNFCGVEVPGLPEIPGGASGPPARFCLAPFLDRWSPSWQDRIVEAHLLRGYTHFLFWAPDSLYGNGTSLTDFVQLVARVKSAGLFTVVNLLSKVYDPKDATWVVHEPRVLPLLNTLLAAGCLDAVLVGMELNLWNVPGGPLQSIIEGVCTCLPPAVLRYVHFSPEVTWWGEDGSNRFVWWSRQVGLLTGLAYQTDPSWDPVLMQGHIADTRLQFARPEWPFDMVIMENQAQAIFNGQRDEDWGDTMGYLSLCGAGLPLMGFGNGARYPSGEVL